MSRLGSADFSYNEIGRYLEKLRQERRTTEQNITGLERERGALDMQIAELERRRNDVNNRLRQEQELATKQERSITQAEEAYKKIIDSSKTLAEFVKNEFQDNRRE